jgi:hypothetical protein
MITAFAALTAAAAVLVPAGLAWTSTQTVWLDSHGAAGPGRVYTGPTVADDLMPGGWYIASAHGTMSYWRPTMWTQTKTRHVCGTTEDAPYYTASSTTGRVGLDAEMVFARPITSGSCAEVTVPTLHSYFQIDAGDGRGFRHLTPIGGHPTTVPDEHVYSYLLHPSAGEVDFRLYDNQTAADNYGELGIIVREATPSDCYGFGYDTLGFTSLMACTTAFGDIPLVTSS